MVKERKHTGRKFYHFVNRKSSVPSGDSNPFPLDYEAIALTLCNTCCFALSKLYAIIAV